MVYQILHPPPHIFNRPGRRHGRSNSHLQKGHGLISGKRGGMFPGNGLGANNQGICFI
jgi:hypothetical protein